MEANSIADGFFEIVPANKFAPFDGGPLAARTIRQIPSRSPTFSPKASEKW
jgi:hypothetical protein